MNSVVVLLLVAVAAFCDASLKPRGVSQQNLSQYRPDQPFTCFDKSNTYSFEHVNDDYCDCPDGSDEPGTSACPNGRFYCPNVGFRPRYIFATFVDDGVCDCCDGSDEQNAAGQSPCPNQCDSLGKIARQAAEEKRATMELGHVVYKDYVQRYETEIGEKRERLKTLEVERTAAEEEKTRLHTAKEEIEKTENEAKDVHHKAWDETKKQLEEERAKKAIEDAFTELDTNKDSKISFDEIKTHLEFDVDGDGVVSDDEARENLEDPADGAADWVHFQEKAWPHIKDVYRKPGAEPPVQDEHHEEEDEHHEEETTPHPYPEEEEEIEEEDRLANERMRQYERPPHTHTEEKKEDELKMPEYPEETKKLIEAADQARTAHEDARSKYDTLDREYSDLLSVTATDFGPDGEFYALRGECYEVDDREYTYRLCPFDRSSQKQKHGHSETNLGRFESWVEDGTNKYAYQKYSNGETCWNGPARSMTVTIKCGAENKISAVGEPNRCEYVMTFATPSACRVPPPPIEHPSFWTDEADHTEL